MGRVRRGGPPERRSLGPPRWRRPNVKPRLGNSCTHSMLSRSGYSLLCLYLRRYIRNGGMPSVSSSARPIYQFRSRPQLYQPSLYCLRVILLNSLCVHLFYVYFTSKLITCVEPPPLYAHRDLFCATLLCVYENCHHSVSIFLQAHYVECFITVVGTIYFPLPSTSINYVSDCILSLRS